MTVPAAGFLGISEEEWAQIVRENKGEKIEEAFDPHLHPRDRRGQFRDVFHTGMSRESAKRFRRTGPSRMMWVTTDRNEALGYAYDDERGLVDVRIEPKKPVAFENGWPVDSVQGRDALIAQLRATGHDAIYITYPEDKRDLSAPLEARTWVLVLDPSIAKIVEPGTEKPAAWANPDHPDSRVRGQRWYHLTTDPEWQYDPARTAVDSTRGVHDEPGRLYVTGEDMLDWWVPKFPEGAKLHAAEIDMSDLVPDDRGETEGRGDYRDPTRRGFIGHPELQILKPEKVKVLRVVPFEQAVAEQRGAGGNPAAQ